MIENRDLYIAIRRAILTVLAVFDRKYSVKGSAEMEHIRREEAAHGLARTDAPQ